MRSDITKAPKGTSLQFAEKDVVWRTDCQNRSISP